MIMENHVDLDDYTVELLDSDDPDDRLTGKIRKELIMKGVDPDSCEVVETFWDMGVKEGEVIMESKPLDWVHGKLLPRG